MPESTTQPIPREKYMVESEIAVRKQWLQQTDYQAIKYAEGELGYAEYAEMKTQREIWRAEINALEEELSHYPQEEFA